MKLLVIAEYQNGKPADRTSELLAFSSQLQAETAMFIAAPPLTKETPAQTAVTELHNKLHFNGKLYHSVSEQPHADLKMQTQAICKIVELEQFDIIVFLHSSYGWDLAPRVSHALKAPCISGVTDYSEGIYTRSAYNGKLDQQIASTAKHTVVTLQAGCFQQYIESPHEQPHYIPIAEDAVEEVQYLGLEAAPENSVDLSKAQNIIAVGNGAATEESVANVKVLSEMLGGEYGATRPVVDAGLMPHDRQIGITGQSISPALYLACGISGAVQHTASIRSTNTIAINTDPDAPISRIANTLLVADVAEFLPLLIANLQKD